MNKQHAYSATITWSGNRGSGTSAYTAYSRDHVISIPGKPDILGSSDPVFRGDASRYNPEDSFVAALSACHMLWYLHLCAVNQVVVESYRDQASGTLEENEDGSGQFREVSLRPEVTIQNADKQALAVSLHAEAHRMCFLARSVNFPVSHQPIVRTA